MKVEIINECMIWISMHIVTCFLNNAYPTDVKNFLGMILVIVASINILGNLGLVVASSAVFIKQGLKEWHSNRKKKIKEQIKIRNFTLITEARPGKF